MASVEIDGYQFGTGTADIEIVVSCGTPPFLGCNATIQRASVELDCGAAVLTKVSYRGWLKTPQRSESAVSIDYGAGSRGKPRWDLRASDAGIGTLVLEPGFAALEGLAPGDEITVQLGTWLMDIQETDCCAPVDGIALVGSDGKELLLSAEELSALKRNVIACIRKTLLPDNNGYVVVASHVLHVVEDERDA